MPESSSNEQREPTHHFSLHNHGVTLPSWLAISMAAAFILATVTFLLTLIELRNLRSESALRSDEIRREIRMLQLHAQDIESVLIRAGTAQRSDFAPWTNGSDRPTKK